MNKIILYNSCYVDKAFPIGYIELTDEILEKIKTYMINTKTSIRLGAIINLTDNKLLNFYIDNLLFNKEELENE